MTPGQTQLTVTSVANSHAIGRVKLTTAPLDAQYIVIAA
jgi:hypothetical protein